VIAHIAEISRRDLHLRMGYRDLFEYVEDRLGFRGGSAGRGAGFHELLWRSAGESGLASELRRIDSTIRDTCGIRS